MARGRQPSRKNFTKGNQREQAEDDETELTESRARMQQTSNAGKMPSSDSEEEDDSKVFKKDKKPLAPAGQNPNAGMMPPSDSESDEEAPKTAKPAGQNKNAGMMPPSDSESESEDDDDDDDDVGAAPQARRPAVPVEKTQKEIEEDMARLALIRKRREDEHKKMIEANGFDIYRDKVPGATKEEEK
mmetsp:Transcript_39582/g.54966  ORF Transcript_39582/g.54966 Transcript_39582/m.54966 type:complete len:187 (-) Transcript_39582:313-873(-)|eukprot:CAMPEP_0196579144 /NCGR_PEP_ID=MMETSP1081-20130531/17679_1 /TAXON_ID=36882 /ORGANISM="Pyramimonas amylifera, Strain CCMP720" /LENGTH=186 /DNA_ID=CAMNT_0041898615 /DNA_START=72 /DNA_END=632 /DNA_ORIENTATION=+